MGDAAPGPVPGARRRTHQARDALGGPTGALPTFLVIGAQKAATTTVYELLREHPDVFLPSVVKEVNFFLDEGAWDRGVGFYESLFEDGVRHRHRGDVSPAYTMFPLFRHAPERAATVLPDARLVYVVRHPVDRMVSAWAQLVGTGFEHRDLGTALLHEAAYSQTSSYGLQLERWLACFDRDALLVLRAEDLAADPGPTIDRLLAHLGLPTGWRPDGLGRAWNRSESKVAPPAPVRRVAGALRSLGLDRAADGLGPRRGVGRRLARHLAEHERRIDPSLARDLEDLFRADAARLRAVVGDEMDLWGLA